MTGLVYTALYWCIRGLDEKFTEDRRVAAAVYKRTQGLSERERVALAKKLRADPKFVKEAMKIEPNVVMGRELAVGLSITFTVIFLLWAAWHFWIVPWDVAYRAAQGLQP